MRLCRRANTRSSRVVSCWRAGWQPQQQPPSSVAWSASLLSPLECCRQRRPAGAGSATRTMAPVHVCEWVLACQRARPWPGVPGRVLGLCHPHPSPSRSLSPLAPVSTDHQPASQPASRHHATPTHTRRGATTQRSTRTHAGRCPSGPPARLPSPPRLSALARSLLACRRFVHALERMANERWPTLAPRGACRRVCRPRSNCARVGCLLPLGSTLGASLGGSVFAPASRPAAPNGRQGSSGDRSASSYLVVRVRFVWPFLCRQQHHRRRRHGCPRS